MYKANLDAFLKIQYLTFIPKYQILAFSLIKFHLILQVQSIENADFYPLDLDISSELKTKMSNGDFCDLKIQAGNDRKNIIMAHKLILAG